MATGLRNAETCRCQRSLGAPDQSRDHRHAAAPDVAELLDVDLHSHGIRCVTERRRIQIRQPNGAGMLQQWPLIVQLDPNDVRRLEGSNRDAMGFDGRYVDRLKFESEMSLTAVRAEICLKSRSNASDTMVPHCEVDDAMTADPLNTTGSATAGTAIAAKPTAIMAAVIELFMSYPLMLRLEDKSWRYSRAGCA
jgi:hypothetical protein